MKNRQKAISTEDKLGVISRLGKVTKLLTYVVLLDSLIAAHVQFLIMLIELNKLLSRELKCLCRKAASPIGKEPYEKLRM